MMSGFDVAIAGAGSVGAPIAWELSRLGLRVGVFDPRPSAGRGENRAAIGGIRATHSEPAKASLCQESIDCFSSWRDQTGEDIEWRQGGYLFVAYRREDEEALRRVVAMQAGKGLDIEWVGSSAVVGLVPGIDARGLLGGAYSAGDGSASPLRAVHSFRVQAERAGAAFHFDEPVTAVRTSHGRVESVVTPLGEHGCDVVVNAAGVAAVDLAAMVGVGLSIRVEGHEAGITEPVARFLEPLVVDMRPGEGSKNLYFYQSATGQVLFCLTPDPPEPGSDRRSTSMFLPGASQRLVQLLPRLRHLRVRRTWRGLYPMTPDGSPLLGWAGADGFFVAAGMCGQGFMLGPGIARLLGRLLTRVEHATDALTLAELDPCRSFVGEDCWSDLQFDVSETLEYRSAVAHRPDCEKCW